MGTQLKQIKTFKVLALSKKNNRTTARDLEGLTCGELLAVVDLGHASGRRIQCLL
jgi:hypothetical protein